jgi:hypothetical protein
MHSEIVPMDAVAIDAQVSEVVAAQAQRNIDSGEALAQLAALYGRMYDLFQAKAPGTPLCGFQRFDEWGTSRFQPLRESMEVSRRQAFYYAKIGRTLLPKIGEAKLIELRIEKAKALLPMVQAKNEVPDDLMEYSSDHSAADIRSEVSRRLFKGNPEHSPGPGREYLVTGPESFVIDLMDDLNYGRQVEFGDGPSDAEILHLMVQAWRQEKAHEGAQENARLSGFGSVSQHALFKLVQFTALLKAKVSMHQDFRLFKPELQQQCMAALCKEFGIPWSAVSPMPGGDNGEEA